MDEIARLDIIRELALKLDKRNQFYYLSEQRSGYWRITTFEPDKKWLSVPFEDLLMAAVLNRDGRIDVEATPSEINCFVAGFINGGTCGNQHKSEKDAYHMGSYYRAKAKLATN